MREEGLKAKRARKFCVTTDSKHEHPIALDTLDRQFDIQVVGDVNRVWVADITYIPRREGWLYLADVLDLASRVLSVCISRCRAAETISRPTSGTAPP